MFKHITLLFILITSFQLQAEAILPVCGSQAEPGDRIVVFCDGSVLIDVADLTALSITVEGFTFNFGPGDFPSGPFLSTDVNNNNLVTIADNASLTVTTSCGQRTFPISQLLQTECVDQGIPPTTTVVTPCGGNVIKISCTGQVYIDLADDVWIYKVWNGGTKIAEWNNFDPDEDDVITTPFLATDFGQLVPNGQNFFLDIQSPSCGQQNVNVSQILAENCGFDYNTNTFGSSNQGLMISRPDDITGRGDDSRGGKIFAETSTINKETGSTAVYPTTVYCFID